MKDLIETAWCAVSDRKEMPSTVFSTHPSEIKRFAQMLVAEAARVVNENDFDGSTLGTQLLYEHFGLNPPPAPPTVGVEDEH